MLTVALLYLLFSFCIFLLILFTFGCMCFFFGSFRWCIVTIFVTVGSFSFLLVSWRLAHTYHCITTRLPLCSLRLFVGGASSTPSSRRGSRFPRRSMQDVTPPSSEGTGEVFSETPVLSPTLASRPHGQDPFTPTAGSCFKRLGSDSSTSSRSASTSQLQSGPPTLGSDDFAAPAATPASPLTPYTRHSVLRLSSGVMGKVPGGALQELYAADLCLDHKVGSGQYGTWSQDGWSGGAWNGGGKVVSSVVRLEEE